MTLFARIKMYSYTNQTLTLLSIAKISLLLLKSTIVILIWSKNAGVIAEI